MDFLNSGHRSHRAQTEQPKPTAMSDAPSITRTLSRRSRTMLNELRASGRDDLVAAVLDGSMPLMKAMRQVNPTKYATKSKFQSAQVALNEPDAGTRWKLAIDGFNAIAADPDMLGRFLGVLTMRRATPRCSTSSTSCAPSV